MVEDAEDYTEAVIIKGSDGIDLITLLTDSDGRLVGVFKGDYEGALETIRLDSEHRMIARAIPDVSGVVTLSHKADAISDNPVIVIGQVPSGKMWRITNIVMYAEVNLCPYIQVYFIRESTTHILQIFKDIPPDFIAHWSGEVWLDEATYLQAYFYGQVTGNKIAMYVQGTEINKL